MPWRYRPKGNRTPKIHPIIGGLVWDQVYDNPACADDPDFIEVKEPQENPAGPSQPAEKSDADTAPEAGKPGRSK